MQLRLLLVALWPSLAVDFVEDGGKIRTTGANKNSPVSDRCCARVRDRRALGHPAVSRVGRHGLQLLAEPPAPGGVGENLRR